MPVSMICTESPALPRMGWFARMDPAREKLLVYHGSSVERGDGWIVEGVWGGDFQRGKFHRSESFFGSGIRVDGDHVHFVPSSATIDRLFWCCDGNEILVSNSLIILMAVTGAKLDETHDYHRESLPTLEGGDAYKGKFATAHPTIPEFRQVFLENIVVSKDGVAYANRFRRHTFHCFEDYFGLLTETLQRIRENYGHPARKSAVSAFTTLSSGYDSTAVTCLAKAIGVRDCFTAGDAYSMIPKWLPGGYAVDDGTPAARQLGMRIHRLRPPKEIDAADELHFMATPYPRNSGMVLNEATFHSMAAHIEGTCPAAAVFCGYHGDLVWGLEVEEKYLQPHILREINSGLNLAEIRLKAGFFSVAVPFLFATSIPDIHNINLLPEMAPWRLNNGYDRPIARRIVESAGVSREAFGQWKKSVCNYYRYPNNARLRRDFFQHIERRYGVRRERIYLGHSAGQAALFAQKALTHLGLRAGSYNRLLFMQGLDLPFLMWIWSADVLSRHLAAQMADSIVSQRSRQ